MAQPLAKPPLFPPVIAPTEDAWRAMSPAARAAWFAQAPVPPTTGEGRRHKKAKTSAIDALGLHFRTIGRAVYLAEEMDVVYPGEPVFTPDVLAVLGVTEPEDNPRMAWVVADEGRERLASCDDLATLERWLLRATSAATEAEVFAS